MSRSYNSLDFINLVAPIMLICYLCIGFVPNLEAVDKIAPQWLIMGFLNLFSLTFFFYRRNSIATSLNLTLKSSLTLTYFAFIIWAAGSWFYAINSTEVLVNLARQFNVFLMFFSMGIFILRIKKRTLFFSWVITLILAVEIYAVLNEAIDMINSSGFINSGLLKGVTANRNITAFSIAIKIPFVLNLIYLLKKQWIKISLSFLTTLALVSLSMIQSRASFIAVGLIAISYIILYSYVSIKSKNNWKMIFHLGYFIIPLIFSVFINKTTLSDKGADAISRAATITVNSSDGSVKKRLRYYSHVFSHMISNPVFGVGLGNWKLKSIEYDAKDITGYVVPYHAHSDFIQLGAELGFLGFVFYLGIFLWAVVYVYRLLRFSELKLDEKVFLFFILTALGVYSVDANLNFPIARPQVLVVWTLIMALITASYQKTKSKTPIIKTSKMFSTGFLLLALLFILPTLYINNSVYKSLKGQMILLQDFNSNNYNLPLNRVDNVVPDIPNITVTTIPINSVKARYYVNAKKYDKALTLLDKGTKANPHLYYSEILKSQIFQEKGQLDSAKFYARKAFFGLPNNDLHASRYINLINITRDREALEEAFVLLTRRNNLNNWKNYLIIANTLYPPNNKTTIERARRATEIFPNNQEIKSLYNQIAVGQAGINAAASYSAKGLEYFKNQNYTEAALEFEKALEANPLDYAHFENAATANYLTGNSEKALEQINVVINELNPLNGKCEYIKALIFIQMGDPIGACPLLATSRDSGYTQAEATFDQYCR